MENSTLNLAHEKQRRADAFLRQGRFEAAAECYERVANLLSDAHGQMKTSLTNSQSSSALSASNLPPVIPSVQSIMTLESLALQSDYHRRQAAVVRMKQAQYEEYKNVLENQQRDLLNKQISKQHGKNHHVDGACESADCVLRQAIYKTIEEQDSLLSLISLPENDDKNFKHPKDNTTVIEELRTINCTLRGLLGNLLNNLEEKEEEIRQLTERLNTLLAINTNDESKVSDAHPRRLAPLPPLAPLEMPVFDFTSS